MDSPTSVHKNPYLSTNLGGFTVKSIHIKLKPSEHAWLTAAAKSDHRSLSSYTTLLILRHLEENQSNSKPYSVPTMVTAQNLDELFDDGD
jgi:hypothetical protein